MKINTEGKNIIPFNEAIAENKAMREEGIFEKVFNKIEDFFPDLGGAELASLLALPDEQFRVLSSYMLDELDKSLNDPNEKLILAQSLNIANISVDDLREFLDALFPQMDKQFNGKISQIKVEFLKRMFTTILNAIQDSQGVSKRILKIPIEFCNENAKMPAYARAGDAGLDLYATEDVNLMPGEQKIIPLGFKVALPRGYAFLIQPRSGLSSKTKLRIANTPGLIDSGFRSELGVIIENIEPAIKDITYDFDDNKLPIIKSILHGSPIHIEKGERFAQMRLAEVPSATFFEVEDINAYEGDRGSGFGGTGKK